MKKFILLTLLMLPFTLFSQEIISQELFKGKIGKDLNIEFYLQIEENGCPNIYAQAMYKYENNKDNNWLLLNTVMNYEKGTYTFVEVFNTGVLLLQKKGDQLNGIWISPDGKKQFPVQLNKVQINSQKIEKLVDQLDKELYEANDC